MNSGEKPHKRRLVKELYQPSLLLILPWDCPNLVVVIKAATNVKLSQTPQQSINCHQMSEALLDFEASATTSMSYPSTVRDSVTRAVGNRVARLTTQPERDELPRTPTFKWTNCGSHCHTEHSTPRMKEWMTVLSVFVATQCYVSWQPARRS